MVPWKSRDVGEFSEIKSIKQGGVITDHCFDPVFSQLNREPEGEEPGENVSCYLCYSC